MIKGIGDGQVSITDFFQIKDFLLFRFPDTPLVLFMVFPNHEGCKKHKQKDARNFQIMDNSCKEKRSDKDYGGKSKSKRRYGSDDSHDIKKKDDKAKDKSKDKKKKSRDKDDFKSKGKSEFKKAGRKKDSGKSRRKKS